MMKLNTKTQLLLLALLGSSTANAIPNANQAITQLDKAKIQTIKDIQQVQHQLIVKWRDESVHRLLLQTPEGAQILANDALSQHQKSAKLERLHLSSQTNREQGLAILSDIYITTGIKLKHLRSSSLNKDIFWTQSNLNIKEVIERLNSTGYFQHIAVAETVTKDSNIPVNSVSLPSTEHVAAASLDLEAFNDPLYLQEFHLAKQGSWTMGHHDFIDANTLVQEQRAYNEKVRIAVIDTGSFPHEDIQWADEGADFVTSYPGSTLIGKCANADNENSGLDMECASEDYLPLTRSSNAIDKEWHFISDEFGNPTGNGTLCIDGHGLNVASTITAIRNNNLGITGAVDNNDVELVPIRAMTCEGGMSFDLADSIVWAAGGEVPGMPLISSPVDIINLSLGSFSLDDCDEVGPTGEAIAYARSQGVVVVAASGNDGRSVTNFTPATCEGVLTVGANNLYGDLALFSNYGEEVDVTFAGVEITAATINMLSYENPFESHFCGIDGSEANRQNCYAGLSGTSFAAPLATAAVALKKMMAPDLSEGELRAAITTSATSYNIDERGLVNRRGSLQPNAGIGNALRALTTSPNLLDITEPQATHHFGLLDSDLGAAYLTQLDNENSSSSICSTYSITWRSPAEAIEDIAYRIWLSNTEDAVLTEENSDLMLTDGTRAIKSAIIDMSDYRRAAIQAVSAQSEGTLFEVDLSTILAPSFCG